MFLKRIDVIGFKSFADKTGIDFAPGITAVVGPNGSGKSNIADAIRWVLGEQSARSLRGTKMEDVIFAGSETRRSINFCEVSLTLDNIDHHLPVAFDEVTVTRRVYRSGESEYLINKQPCRLKDITELFMDSGLGRESYSIIGQGRIEEMLSTRPEDRRGPFEDAAGIVKFKFRRKEAERKLDETATNILRVDDILAELERSAGPLEQEAHKAAAYKALQSELTVLDVGLLAHEIEVVRSRYVSISQTIEDLSQQRLMVVGELANTEQQLQTNRKLLETKNEALEFAQRQLVEAVEERQRIEGNVALLEERVVHADTSLVDKHHQMTQLVAETEELQMALSQNQERLQIVVGRHGIKAAELEVAAQAVDPAVRADLEREIAAHNAELIEMHHDSAALRNELKMAEESQQSELRKRERLVTERTTWEAEIERLQSETTELEQMQTTISASIARVEAEQNTHAEHVKKLAEAEADCVSQIYKVQSSMASLKSRSELLKELEDGYDGYALGVKTVLQAADRDKLQGIRGSLATLLAVPKEYEVAIETALGGALQNIVVNTEADARSAIEMLKARQSGRATFMPMSVIKTRRLAASEVSKVESHPGYLGLASDLIRYDQEYVDIVENLLGNVVLAKKLVDANDLARKLAYRVRIVTLEGDVVSPGGSMSGGSHVRKGPGLLGRTRERQDVQKQIEALEQSHKQLEQQKTALRGEMSAYQNAQVNARNRLEELRTKWNQTGAEIRENQANEQNAKDRLTALDWEWKQYEDIEANWRQRMSQAKEKLHDTQTKLTLIEDTLAQQRAALAERDKAVADAQAVVTSLKVEVATLVQEKSAVELQISDQQSRLDRMSSRELQLRTDVERLSQTMTETKAAIDEARDMLVTTTASVESLEDLLASLRLERASNEADVVAVEKQVRAQQQSIAAVDEQIHRSQVQAERADSELNYALTRLSDTYHITYEWAKEHYPHVEDVEGTKREADRLKREIARLGDVQIGAIEEWQRLSERMHFLQSERADLEAAKDQLRAVIQEIDDEMSRRFIETFEQIRAEFQVSFRLLFGGGRADLQLTDKEDTLHTGIEVIAQPPGKKLQNLNLLSGGERALTAMGLLFAILKVRPVPFCVLDEVEAALDEANVHRFAQQVRAFSADTQFIVITHRRGTMEEADALYGVTMQESGISSLIGVRLSDDSHDTVIA